MKWNHHKPLLLELEPVRGFYVPEMPPPYGSHKRIELKVPNKAYRNFVYWVNSFLVNSDQPVITTTGWGFNINQFKSSQRPSSISPYHAIPEFGRFMMAYGSSGNPHDITRYELYSRNTSHADGFGWAVWEESSTKIITYARLCFGAPSITCGEAGLYFQTNIGAYERTIYLIARATIDPPITKEYNTLYEEGWIIEFPSEYTRVLPSMIAYCTYWSATSKFMFRDSTGTLRRIRSDQPSAGSPDVMIGSDNTPPSPDGYALKSPIASLSSQSHTVEVDTTLQELRIIRQGTYTPSTNVTLGEVALFANVYDDTGTACKMMIARGVFDPPVTLTAGVTYTIGIVLKM